MDFRKYQEEALKTDQIPTNSGNGIIVPLLGLVGEAGTLLTEYKKYLRDGDAHKLFKEGVAEELGDLLWYVANVASKFELDLDVYTCPYDSDYPVVEGLKLSNIVNHFYQQKL